MQQKLKVGQVITVSDSHYSNNGHTVFDTEIESVGRKFFTLKGIRKRKFLIETLREEPSAVHRYTLYFLKQDYLDEREKFKLITDISEKIASINLNKMTIENLKHLNNALGGMF
jgi:hypothetical protein